MSKISEKCVAEQLTNHLKNAPFSNHPRQFQFHHSNETANCFFVENIKLKLDKDGVVGAIFFNLKFDTANHHILIYKHTHFNFSNTIH